MIRNMTPAQAYKRTQKAAKKAGMLLCPYVESRGLKKSCVNKWKNKKTGTVRLDYAVKLRIV